MVLQGARVPSTIASYLPRADTISQILRILIAVFEVVSPLHMYIYIPVAVPNVCLHRLTFCGSVRALFDSRA